MRSQSGPYRRSKARFEIFFSRNIQNMWNMLNMQFTTSAAVESGLLWCGSRQWTCWGVTLHSWHLTRCVLHVLPGPQSCWHREPGAPARLAPPRRRSEPDQPCRAGCCARYVRRLAVLRQMAALRRLHASMQLAQSAAHVHRGPVNRLGFCG